MFYYCRVCRSPYLTQREADLCTPAELIEWRYGPQSVDVRPTELSLAWLEEE